MKQDVTEHCDSCKYFGCDLHEYEVIINQITLEKKVFHYCDLCIDSKASIISRIPNHLGDNKDFIRIICHVGNQILNALNSFTNKEAKNVN